MKPVAAVVAIILATLSGLLGAVPSVTTAVAEAAEPAPAQGGEPHQVQALQPDGPLQLDLTQVGPRVVTSTGPDTLTVTGTLTNTGNVPISNLVIRAQRGVPLQTEGALRDALDGSAATDAVTPAFVPIPGEVAPGGQIPVQLSVPLRGPADSSLALTSTGVYELLVNVNGAPRDGARARLAAVRMLLPVLSLPAAPGSPATTAPPPDTAMPFTMLFPITETPRRIPTVPGEQPVLTDDDLAASFAPDGRLGALVAALTQQAPPGSRLRASICLAIDPDLVETASVMSQPAGYLVRRPDGSTVPGTGGAAAGQWLGRLATVARSGCVLALPYADADLVALTRGGMGALAGTAVTDGRQVLDQILQIQALPTTSWPVDGATDQATLDVLGQASGRAVVLSADAVEQGRSERATGTVPIEGGTTPQFAVLTDPLLTSAAAGLGGSDPDDESGRGSAATSTSPAGGTGPMSTQDLIGTLAFRTDEDTAFTRASGGGPLVLAPPHDWTPDGDAATALLTAVGEMLDTNLITPSGLDATVAAGPAADATPVPLAYPLQAGGREVPSAAVDIVRATSAQIDDLASAAVADAGVGVSPGQVFTPLRHGLLRPVSAEWRGQPDAADQAARVVMNRVAELRGTVRVLDPPGPYSLATSDAPILITLTNGLPITIQVRVQISSSSGLRVAPIDPQLVPPLGRRQVRVSAEVVRAGQFTVQASVTTPRGELLGPPSRLRVRSTVYGTITVWLTASAGILLVVLAGRRVLRRVRGEPGTRTDQGRPAPPRGPLPDDPEPGPSPTGHPAVQPSTAQPPTVQPPTGPPPPVPPRSGPAPHPAPAVRPPTVPSRTAEAPRPPAPHPGVGRGGDPFPDPLGPTERLPVTPPRRDGPPRPPGPPRVPSP